MKYIYKTNRGRGSGNAASFQERVLLLFLSLNILPVLSTLLGVDSILGSPLQTSTFSPE